MKPLSPVLLAAVLSVAAANENDEWLAFKQRFGRVYEAEEEVLRRWVFVENLERIRLHNAEHDAGRSTFRLGVNQFADLTNEEFRQKLLTEPVRGTPTSVNVTAPDSFDWRTEGVPIRIQDQGQLGASWTIATLSSVEAGVFLSSGQTVSLSDQNLLDCVSWPSTGRRARVQSVITAWPSEADYPTTGGVGACQPVAPSAGLDEVHQVLEGDEVALAEGLLQNPVPVMFDVEFSFQLYSSGIYSDPGCSPDQLNHALLLVGYGSSGQDFWTLANSWGTSWGEGGYVRVPEGRQHVWSGHDGGLSNRRPPALSWSAANQRTTTSQDTALHTSQKSETLHRCTPF
ncbi:Cathepsin L-like proteinase [Amphibalanus amphitrite]|uniref:Cathepsin L-like proteinase n=1 Tax=Amphibalanus amphitrite TaxID=1232801 RepID=A0A6A4VBK4_AMPAM|nr:Cathepsin L-like proteinase [Amphibalanus amphitrite]